MVQSERVMCVMWAFRGTEIQQQTWRFPHPTSLRRDSGRRRRSERLSPFSPVSQTIHNGNFSFHPYTAFFKLTVLSDASCKRQHLRATVARRHRQGLLAMGDTEITATGAKFGLFLLKISFLEFVFTFNKLFVRKNIEDYWLWAVCL